MNRFTVGAAILLVLLFAKVTESRSISADERHTTPDYELFQLRIEHAIRRTNSAITAVRESIGNGADSFCNASSSSIGTNSLQTARLDEDSASSPSQQLGQRCRDVIDDLRELASKACLNDCLHRPNARCNRRTSRPRMVSRRTFLDAIDRIIPTVTVPNLCSTSDIEQATSSTIVSLLHSCQCDSASKCSLSVLDIYPPVCQILTGLVSTGFPRLQQAVDRVKS